MDPQKKADLTNLSIADLKKLVDCGQISQDDCKELKSLRRRLQNRKYARKCAKKKEMELTSLSLLVNDENADIDFLKNQLKRIKISNESLQNQIECIKSITNSSEKSARPIKILNAEGGISSYCYYRGGYQQYHHHLSNKNLFAKNCTVESQPPSHHPVNSNPRLVRPAGGGYLSTSNGHSDF